MQDTEIIRIWTGIRFGVWNNYQVLIDGMPEAYFTSFSAHVSQYFSMSVAPSTLNNASWVAMLPQLTQNFDFPPTSTNALSNENTFSILLFHPCKDLINRTYCIRSNHNSVQLFEYKNLTNQHFINKCKNKGVNWAISGGWPTRVILINCAQHSI